MHTKVDPGNGGELASMDDSADDVDVGFHDEDTKRRDGGL